MMSHVALLALAVQGPGCLAPTHTVRDALVRALPVSGRVLVANQFSETATWIDLATRQVRQLRAGSSPHNVAISANGRWGVVSNFGDHQGDRSAPTFSGNRLYVVEMRTGLVAREIQTGELTGLHDLSFRPGYPDRVLVTAQSARRVIEVDVVTGEITGQIDTRGDRSHTLAVTPDGLFAFTTNEGSATVTRLDVAARRPVRTFPAAPEVEGIAVTADGRELWVGLGVSDSAVHVLHAVTGEVLARLRGFRHPVRMTRGPSAIVISDLGCRSVMIADPATRRIVRVLRGPDRMAVGAVDASGRYGFAAVWPRQQLIVLDLETGAVLARFRAGRGTDGVAWGPT